MRQQLIINDKQTALIQQLQDETKVSLWYFEIAHFNTAREYRESKGAVYIRRHIGDIHVI